jgi:thiol-disulfide isomerase/thioredoxin
MKPAISDRKEQTWVEVVLVRSPACHLCDDATEALGELGEEFPLRVRIVDVESPEGRVIVAEHRPALFPAVLIDGQLFSAGRLPRKKLRRLLERMA